MEVREFVFRNMHGPDKPALELRGLRNSEIKNTPACRKLCGRFLMEEIHFGGQPKTPEYYVREWKRSKDRWLRLAEHFITTIIPSHTFMMDCILFFSEIREGKI